MIKMCSLKNQKFVACANSEVFPYYLSHNQAKLNYQLIHISALCMGLFLNEGKRIKNFFEDMPLFT